MKFLPIIFFAAFLGCNNAQTSSESKKDSASSLVVDSSKESVEEPDIKKESPPAQADSIHQPQVYSNKRFQDVTVSKVNDTSFRIKGKAQIFEANFSWVIEDGHNELKKGFEMTDAGAPAWGNFDFVVSIEKPKRITPLHLILFETSAKDGSRQYELPIRLM